jgi:signal transduction histidine kinase
LPARDRVDLHEGIESTLAILGHQLRAVTVTRSFGDLPRVDCYPNQLNQVWMNLLNNAAQAVQHSGSITIRTRPNESTVQVDIEDTGTGMAPHVLARIFEPGFTTKDGRIGMGLGLLIAQQIIERHRGRITVTSQEGKGSTFTVELPVNLPSTIGGDHA